jgi:hypothetical protein
VHELSGLLGISCERLVDDDRQLRVERSARQRDVSAVRRGHDDEVELVRSAPQVIRRIDKRGIRVLAPRPGAPLAVPGDNRGELEAGDRRDERGVEDRSRQAVADESHPSARRPAPYPCRARCGAN